MKITLRGRKRERREGNTGSTCRDNERAIFIKREKEREGELYRESRREEGREEKETQGVNVEIMKERYL